MTDDDWMGDEPAVDPLLDGDDASKLNRIAELEPMQYERLRESLAKGLGVRVSALDREREKRRAPIEAATSGLNLDDPKPWPEAVATAALLNAISLELERYMVMPATARDVCALWCALTYTRVFFVLPMLAIQSPQKRCGKSTLLILLRQMASRALLVANMSPPALFRVVDKYSPTLLLDEADAWMKENDELRGIINCGHTKETAYVIRVEGTDVLEPRRFSVFCPKAIAGIGTLPDTIEDRSIVVGLKRRRPDEPVEQLRQDRINLTHVRALAVRWAADCAAALKVADPAVPMELHDRAADNWRPLLAIADLAEDDWPTRARKAAIAAAVAEADQETMSVLLLRDIRTIFGKVDDRIGSDDLVQRLHAIEDRPWSEWGKARKPITQVQLARVLAPFKIKPDSIRFPGVHATRKGYLREWFADAFARYAQTPDSSGTPEQTNGDAGFPGIRSGTPDVHVPDRNGTFAADGSVQPGVPFRNGTRNNPVPDQKSQNPNNGAECSGVPFQTAEKARAEGIRCRDCMYYDPDGDAGCGPAYCLKLDRVTDPDTERHCPEFRVPR